MQADRNLVLLVGGVDSGKQDLEDLIIGQENSKIDSHGRELRISNSCFRIYETTSQNRDVSLNLLRSETVDTCFVVVIDITNGAEFVNELVRLKELSEYLADCSYSLFWNCLVAFTHINELADGVDEQQLVDRDFGEILCLVDRRCVFTDSTIRTQENRDRVLAELIHLSKPVLRILCYGNNNFRSEKFQLDLSEENAQNIPFRISLHHAPDLNLFDRFPEPVSTPELVRLIGQQELIGMGISVFVILISLKTIFSQNMLELLTSIPDILGLREECKDYFWDKVVIAFDTNGHSNPEEMINLSIEGNIGIKEMVRKAGGRYTYLSQTNPQALLDKLLIQIHKIRHDNLHTEFIGGRDVNRRALRYRRAGNGVLARLTKSVSYILKFFIRKPKLSFITLTIGIAIVGLIYLRNTQHNLFFNSVF